MVPASMVTGAWIVGWFSHPASPGFRPGLFEKTSCGSLSSAARLYEVTLP